MYMNFSEFERDNLIYDYVTLTDEERKVKKDNYEKMMAEKAAQKEAALKAKEKENKDKPEENKK